MRRTEPSCACAGRVSLFGLGETQFRRGSEPLLLAPTEFHLSDDDKVSHAPVVRPEKDARAQPAAELPLVRGALARHRTDAGQWHALIVTARVEEDLAQ